MFLLLFLYEGLIFTNIYLANSTRDHRKTDTNIDLNFTRVYIYLNDGSFQSSNPKFQLFMKLWFI